MIGNPRYRVTDKIQRIVIYEVIKNRNPNRKIGIFCC